MSIKVKNEVNVYEVDGKECKGLPSQVPHLKVRSHWNREQFVVLQIDDGKEITVLAKELRAAIANSQNMARF